MSVNKRNKRQQGFSLVEMVIVVTVIGVISSIAVPSFLNTRKAGNEAATIASLAVSTQELITAAREILQTSEPPGLATAVSWGGLLRRLWSR